MKTIVWCAALAACAGAGPAMPQPPAEGSGSSASGSGAGSAARARKPDAPSVDPIAALAPRDDEPVSWLVPGRMQLELGGSPIDGAGDERALDVTVIDRQGSTVRAAVRLEHARFSVWTDRARLLGVLQRDQRITETTAGEPPGIEVVLRAGARVRRLAHKDGRTQIRYTGAQEVEGWIADGALGDTWPRRDRHVGRIPSGRRTLFVIPGAVIRAEPKWTGRALATATLRGGQNLDTIREVDREWTEVAYTDGDVAVHGFVSRQAPPGRVHGEKAPPVPPPVVTPNGKVASGTCLYARKGGEQIGYIVGDRDAELEDQRGGWWRIAIDSPWGPIVFAARGPLQTDLVACAPQGSVPPPAGSAPPVPPPSP